MCYSVSKNILKSKQEGIVQVFKNISFMFILIYSFQFRNIYLLSLLISLRSSRFLSFSKRSRKTAKSGKISRFVNIPVFLLTPSLLLPNFLAHPRRAPSLARFSFACSISAPPEKGKESTATQATVDLWTSHSFIDPLNSYVHVAKGFFF